MSGSAARSNMSLAVVAATAAATTACIVVWHDNYKRRKPEKEVQVKDDGAFQTFGGLTANNDDGHSVTTFDKLPSLKKKEWMNAPSLRSMFSLISFNLDSKSQYPLLQYPLLLSHSRHQTDERVESPAVTNSLDSRFKVNWRKPLGEGSFGVVYRGTDRLTGDKVAVKKIPKRYTDSITFRQEMDALKLLRAAGGHPNICGLRESFEDGNHYYLILDLVSGGELFERCKMGAYTEADAAKLVREIASALAFMHSIGIVHADLKPENLMFSSRSPMNAPIQVVDFGSAQLHTENAEPNSSAQHNRTHTTAYSPPEKLRQKHISSRLDPSFDMWSLGIILYIVLTGVHPFDLDGIATDAEIEEQVLAGHKPPLRQSPLTARLSGDAIGLIEQLLQWNPTKRLTALQVLEHPWMNPRLSMVPGLI